MSMTINQLHEAAKAFRVQFRPLIEVLDAVAEISNMQDTQRELQESIASLTEERAKIDEANEAAEQEYRKVKQDIKKRQAQDAAQTQEVAEQIAEARRVAAAEAERVRREVSATIGYDQSVAAEQLAELDDVKQRKEEEVAVLEARLEMLRKAIASIVVGAEG